MQNNHYEVLIISEQVSPVQHWRMKRNIYKMSMKAMHCLVIGKNLTLLGETNVTTG